MATQTAQRIDTGPASATDFNQYAVGSRLEISQILHAIMRQATLITASVSGDDFFLTTLLAVDDDGDCLVLECGRHSEQAQRVLKRQRLLCSTSLDKIKIQFVCESIEAVEFDGHAAFRTPLPQDLMRLQRREYYRMSIPRTAPVKCTLSSIEGDASAKVELNLLDISCGGIAVVTPPEMFAPELGTHYACTIRLPGVPALSTRVQARNGFMLKLANGKLTQRTGFQFVKLPESMLAAIQRYIMNVERERRARAA